ncbi:signal transduction histidine kinase [Murinocardiopsis flavida]|uniref:histidine kinase n=1 Tax=Murinocardiopsis flavida TaxID=645275 RepID=A0A2P8D511_9ACTN|nr:histidine kinase [Murinocardiopsis flavida]PSK92306.1 signal transduction histidine kinase [Murinocardiopsis flavida]
MSTLNKRFVRDLVLVAVLAAVLVVFSPLVPRDSLSAPRDLDPLGYALLIASCAVLLGRHRWPGAALVATTACVLTYTVLHYPGYFFPVAPVWALYAAVAYGRRVLGAVVSVVVPVTILIVSMRQSSDPAVIADGPAWIAGWMVAAAVGGEISRRRTSFVNAVQARALAAEQALEETARRRAGEERLRIARELHDSLTHTLSVMNVQAGVAVHLLDKQPHRDEETYRALTTIKAASHEALRELRATLGVLRTRGEPPGPPPSLRRLPELVKAAEDTGSRVEVVVEGRQRPLPVEVDRAAYRVVQEALTNAARHAPGARVAVRVGYRGEAVVIDIEDDGSPAATRTAAPAPGGDGHGLVGMRERVVAVDGTLRAGPRSPSGYAVHAILPVDPESPVPHRPDGLDQG